MRNLWSRRAAILLLVVPGAAWADFTGTATVPAGSGLNLATGAVASGGGDLVYNGTQMVPQGAARAISIGNLQASGFALISMATVQANDPAFNALPANFPVTVKQGDVLAARTTGGSYAKVLVQSISSASATLQYVTYGVSGAPAGPAISAVQNNYSYLQAGLPNYGIAPGSLFIVKGTDLASATTPVLQSSGGSGIPTTLNGASIAVTVNGVTTNPGLYYAISTQLAAVLPSSTPVGTGTITVTYNGVTSSTFPIQVVASALGFDTYYGSGTGLAAATDLSYNLLSYTHSAKPGQQIVLWGSGLGADTADSDTTVTSSPHAINVPLTIYVGGIQASIGYQGASGYPGLNQINVTVPSNVQAGCGVAVTAISGTVVSNTVTIPVDPSGGNCSDPVIDGTTQSFAGTSYKFGSIQILQAASSASVYNGASAVFETLSAPAGVTQGQVKSMGNCVEAQSVVAGGVSTSPLDAGSVSVQGGYGTTSLPVVQAGDYSAQLPAGALPSTGGSFVFTGTGGKDVGAFTATLSYTSILNWTNASAIPSVTRSQGVTVTWTGGDPNGYVLITGTSSTPSTATQAAIGAGFTCYAPIGAGTFTVPSYVLLGMPAGQGSLSVENATTPISFTATGLDYAYGFAAFYTSKTLNYQ